MGLELYMVGLIVADMGRAIEFYRRLGLDIPPGSEEHDHVEVKMSGLTFFLTNESANARWDPARRAISGDGYRIVLEFYLETAEALDAKYAELTRFGYTGHHPPYDVTPQTRFALVDDPDGNTILLSSKTASGTEG
jgi:catechol 2,3-dioxygenase-like lactoylglutathione lyase family enzyme